MLLAVPLSRRWAVLSHTDAPLRSSLLPERYLSPAEMLANASVSPGAAQPRLDHCSPCWGATVCGHDIAAIWVACFSRWPAMSLLAGWRCTTMRPSPWARRSTSALRFGSPAATLSSQASFIGEAVRLLIRFLRT